MKTPQLAHGPSAVIASATAILACTATMPATATVLFENLPTNVEIVDHTVSHHGVGGPILADDFVSTDGGAITRVEWWGSNATDNHWELAFHTDNPTLHQPNVDDPWAGAMIKYGEDGSVVATGVEDVPGHPGIFHYTVDLPLALTISAGTEYWFTVANFVDGWHWAYALGGPTVGSENYNAHVSTGLDPCGDGGPHCGSWTDVHTDFAFRVIPEPGSLALIALALGALGLSRRASDPGASAAAA